MPGMRHFLTAPPASGRPVAMSRGRPKNRESWTAEEILADVIQWADQQQFAHVAAALRNALHLLKKEKRQQ
jgi:hypothetical protein